jgi:RNA polymerase sigma-70 factor (ECF subfamily)
MREIEGLSYEEISYKTEQNINTLRVTLSRARKIIREEYNKYHHERRGFKEVDRQVL